MSKFAYDKQDQTIAQFNRINRMAARNPEPTWFEKQVIESKQRAEAYRAKNAKKVEEPRISFYNPNNPLNGFSAKSKSEQREITQRLKAEAKAKAKLAKETTI
jgi:hypothetical protein